MGNRVWKSSTVDGVTTAEKYLVDISGQLPTILCVVDAADPNLMTSSYYYADAQVLAQRTYPDPNVISDYNQQFYVHDRLGSVRLVVDYNDIDATVSVANSYTYTPFGSHYDGEAPAETLDNPFKFTGQRLNVEINQYYLRARMYDPTMMRFTSRDPVRGEQNEPLTLHKYLYCVNEPVNRIDPSGEISALAKAYAGGVLAGVSAYAQMTYTAAYAVESENWDFLDIAFDIGKIMPAIIAIGAGAGPVPFYYKLFPNIVAGQVGKHMSGYDIKLLDHIALSSARVLFHMSVLNTRNRVGIADEEMEDFNEWLHR